MAVVAPMASMATMDSMAPMASMMVASMASMASTAWMDLTARELNVGFLQLSLQLAAAPRENDGSRSLRRVVRIGGMRTEGSCKIGGASQNCWKNDAGKIEEEFVMNELMGSTANEEFERRIAASWCGSRVAVWRVAVGKATVLMADITSLASKASLVSLECDGASNGNDDDSKKTGDQCDVYNSCFSFDGFAGAVGEFRWRQRGPDGFNGFDGVDSGFGGFDCSDGVDGFGFDASMVASMAPMVSMVAW